MVESVRRWFHAWLGFATPRCTEEYAAYSCPECKDALQSTAYRVYSALRNGLMGAFDDADVMSMCGGNDEKLGA